MSEIVLYPGNWLYNAGVVGLLRVLEELGEKLENYLKNDGCIDISVSQSSDKIFNKWNALTEDRLKQSYKGKKGGTKSYYYANQTENSIKEKIDDFISPPKSRRGKKRVCVFCSKNEVARSKDIKPLTQAYSKVLIGAVDNFYWNSIPNDYICSRCKFIIMCHHIAFTKLSNDSEIFINAPSFEVMWYLNKYAREAYGREKIKATKEILGISLIEAVLKLHIQLGKWTMMNIEVVNKYKTIIDEKTKIDKVDFFSLPYEIVLLLSDNKIASLLDDVGEFSVLNLVLDGNFRRILELAERIFKIALKPEKERGTQEKNFMNDKVRLKKNKENLILFSQKLFKLYALIEEKAKKEVSV